MFPVNPWLAAMPEGKDAPGPADVAQAGHEAKAIEDTLRLESGMSEIVKVGLYMALIGACVFAIWLAADKALVILE